MTRVDWSYRFHEFCNFVAAPESLDEVLGWNAREILLVDPSEVASITCRVNSGIIFIFDYFNAIIHLPYTLNKLLLVYHSNIDIFLPLVHSPTCIEQQINFISCNSKTQHAFSYFLELLHLDQPKVIVRARRLLHPICKLFPLSLLRMLIKLSIEGLDIIIVHPIMSLTIIAMAAYRLPALELFAFHLETWVILVLSEIQRFAWVYFFSDGMLKIVVGDFAVAVDVEYFIYFCELRLGKF